MTGDFLPGENTSWHIIPDDYEKGPPALSFLVQLILRIDGAFWSFINKRQILTSCASGYPQRQKLQKDNSL
jgi:hypothetical protein